MSERGTVHVLIIGGGIAGPALGLFLAKAGIRSTVYEAEARTAEVGAGLNLAPNGMNVLDALGLAGAVRSRGTVALEHCFRTERGRVLARYANGGSEYGQPSVNLRRSDLHWVLADALEQRGVGIEYGKRLTAVSRPAGERRVVARFADGSEAEGDLVVGADGVSSRTREFVAPDGPRPGFVGIVGVGGFTPVSAVPGIGERELRGLTFTYGRDGFFGYGGARPGELMWWSNLWRDHEPSAEDRNLSPEAILDEMRGLYRGYHAPIAALLEHSDLPVSHAVHDIQTLPRWHRDGVVLIGDAAHAVSPNSGQGASLALEDAMYLAKVLRDAPGDSTEALARFERDRRPRCERIVAEGRRRSSDKKRVGWAASVVRNLFLATLLPLFAKRGQDWVYRYRIEW